MSTKSETEPLDHLCLALERVKRGREKITRFATHFTTTHTPSREIHLFLSFCFHVHPPTFSRDPSLPLVLLSCSPIYILERSIPLVRLIHCRREAPKQDGDSIQKIRNAVNPAVHYFKEVVNRRPFTATLESNPLAGWRHRADYPGENFP